jgi:hypothetical protein
MPSREGLALRRRLVRGCLESTPLIDITDADAGGFVCRSRRATVEKLGGQAQTLM